MRLIRQSLGYSRDGGCFTVEGAGAGAVGDRLATIEGITGQEWDSDALVYCLTWDKRSWSWVSIKEHYQLAKRG